MSKISELERQALIAKNSPQKVNQLNAELANIENKIGNINLDSSNVQQTILGLVTNYCQKNNVVLREFPSSITQQENDITIETNYFSVEGDFLRLLQLVNSLEQHSEIGKITSTHFKSKKNIKTKSVELTMTVYVQNFKKSST
jgi:hypothetical protein